MFNYKLNSWFLYLVSASQKYRKSILSCISILYLTFAEKVSYLYLGYFFDEVSYLYLRYFLKVSSRTLELNNSNSRFKKKGFNSSLDSGKLELITEFNSFGINSLMVWFSSTLLFN